MKFFTPLVSLCGFLLLPEGAIGYEVAHGDGEFKINGGGRVISDTVDVKRDARKIEMMFPLRDGTELHTYIFLPRASTGPVRLLDNLSC